MDKISEVVENSVNIAEETIREYSRQISEINVNDPTVKLFVNFTLTENEAI